MEAADPALRKVLTTALEVQSDETRVQAHVHGFHSYPARLHPETARRLILELCAPGKAVLDPFCGSGTVVVEARSLGRRAFGSDLNPLAVELTRLKAGGVTREFADALAREKEQVVLHALERKRAELGPTEKYGPEDRTLFAPHVLLELDGLRSGIEAIRDRTVRNALALVHSALLTKLSERTSDSSTREQKKRISGGFAIRFFGMKTDELVRRALEYSTLVPPGTPPPRVQIADARRLEFLRDASVRLIVSSPPYPGVYDYYEHHRVRLRWLRLDGARFAQGELASRRAARGARAGGRDVRPRQADASANWQRDFAQCLREIWRVLEPGGHAALIVGDSVFAGRPLHANLWLPPLAEDAGLVLRGRADQERPYFHAPTGRAFSGAPRREHLFVLERPTQ